MPNHPRIENAFDFEKMVLASFRQTGYEVELNKRSNEPGYDFRAKENTTEYAVQVKNHTRPVNISTVNRFRTFIDNSPFEHGILISSLGFSSPAITAIQQERPKGFYLGRHNASDNSIEWVFPETGIAPPPPPPEPHYIAVFTATGGVGKTTVSAHLAGALRLLGYKNSLIDADPDANLSRVSGGKITVPNTRTGEISTIHVYSSDTWIQHKNTVLNSSIILDCSPKIEDNNLDLLRKVDTFIIPYQLTSLQVGNNAEVIERSVKRLRALNTQANILVVLNSFNKRQTASERNLFEQVQRAVLTIQDKQLYFLMPEDVAIRESQLLKHWGENSFLCFEPVAGRCYPRDDFLKLAESLLEYSELNQHNN